MQATIKIFSNKNEIFFVSDISVEGRLLEIEGFLFHNIRYFLRLPSGRIASVFLLAILQGAAVCCSERLVLCS